MSSVLLGRRPLQWLQSPVDAWIVLPLLAGRFGVAHLRLACSVQYQVLFLLYLFILLHFSPVWHIRSHCDWLQTYGCRILTLIGHLQTWQIRLVFVFAGPGFRLTSPAMRRLRGSKAGFFSPPAKNPVLCMLCELTLCADCICTVYMLVGVLGVPHAWLVGGRWLYGMLDAVLKY